MNSFLRYDVILVKYPFSDLTIFKVRPAIVVNDYYPSNDIIIVPLTSNTNKLLPGEFILTKWKESGLNVQSTVKRGIYTIDEKLVILKIGTLTIDDSSILEESLRLWLNLF